MPAVSNSTPLIHVAALGDLHVLERLLGTLTIPQAVYDEVVIAGAQHRGAAEIEAATGSWLTIASIANHQEVQQLVEIRGLDNGEAEAIVLAHELGLGTVLIDDQDGVMAARSHGLEVIPTPALYVRAKEYGVITAVKPKIDGLRRLGFWLRDSDYEEVLRRARET